MGEIIKAIVDFVDGMGYVGIFIMMFLESSFFPFPSEVAMIPAGYLAYQGKMDIYIAIFAGILGSLAGALFNYYLAKKYGRGFLEKYGKYVFVSKETLTKMDDFFDKHGEISTFTGRLIPVVRQYISLPAGLCSMNILTFSIFTVLGAGIWVVILAYLGYFVGYSEELIKTYLHEIIIWTLIVLALIIAIYIWVKKNEKNRSHGE